jgi:hypothetical protein
MQASIHIVQNMETPRVVLELVDDPIVVFIPKYYICSMASTEFRTHWTFH